MGLPIDGVNQPSVSAANGPISNNVKDLIAARGRLVAELDELLEVLKSVSEYSVKHGGFTTC
jgi:hypothetical protein